MNKKVMRRRSRRRTEGRALVPAWERDRPMMAGRRSSPNVPPIIMRDVLAEERTTPRVSGRAITAG
tara:strand:- start:1187 stop:1384 length:198 start_codon:yes stop_codon:yes gene_type:complete